jgi:hypothetical protein
MATPTSDLSGLVPLESAIVAMRATHRRPELQKYHLCVGVGQSSAASTMTVAQL